MIDTVFLNRYSEFSLTFILLSSCQLRTIYDSVRVLVIQGQSNETKVITKGIISLDEAHGTV